MIKYQVRSKELIDLVNEIKFKRLILSPYFQRNLVWRQLHKDDFIKTILMGYPFPQIFIARGSIDLENMSTTSCIVDGQQRSNAIVEFVNDKFAVDGKRFSELDATARESFLKYQVPIIDLDISNDDPQIKEIFKRLNRTFYSLSTIEKWATEYASSEFMLIAKLLSIKERSADSEEEYEPSALSIDPSIPATFIEWSQAQSLAFFPKLLNEVGIFSPYELTRKVHLMYTLNVIATFIGGFYNRNELAISYLQEFSESVPDKDRLLATMERAAKVVLELGLEPGSYWLTKANIFSLLCLFSRSIDAVEQIAPGSLRDNLGLLLSNLPDFYKIAAKEGVNNRKERLERNGVLSAALLGHIQND